MATKLLITAFVLFLMGPRSDADLSRINEETRQALEMGIKRVAKLGIRQASDRTFIPVGYVYYARSDVGQRHWREWLIALPSAEAQPDFPESTRKELKEAFPRLKEAKSIDGYFLIYAEGGKVHLQIHLPGNPIRHYSALYQGDKDIAGLQISDLKAE